MVREPMPSVFSAPWRLGGSIGFLPVLATLLFAMPARADEQLPGYLIPAEQVETVYALQRLGYPVTELREEIELDVEVATVTGPDMVSRTLKQSTVKAKPGMFLVRTERPVGVFAGLCWSPGLSRSSWSVGGPRPAEAGTPTKAHPVTRLRPNQYVFTGRTRPLPEYRVTGQPFTAEQLKLGRRGLAGDPMDDVTWLPDGEHWLQAKEGRLCKVEARTGRSTVFVEPRKLMLSLTNLPGIDYKELPKQLAVPHYTFSPTFKAVLVKHGKSYYIAFLDGRDGVKIGECEVPSFSPDGGMLAFVRKGNLCVAVVGTGNVFPLTSDGGEDGILNGRADWVYEEEVFHRKGQAYWWSPNGDRIAFLRFDDSQVPKFAITHNDDRHSTVETINYPKPGDKNPTVRVEVAFLDESKFRTTTLLDGANKPEVIVSRLGWIPGEKPVPFAYLQDRTQTLLAMTKWPNIDSKQAAMCATKSETWVEDPGEPHWLKDGSFLILANDNGRNRVFRIDSIDRRHKTMITKGDTDVTGIFHVDEDAGLVWYTCKRGAGTGDYILSAPISKDAEPPELRGLSSQSYKINAAPKGGAYIVHYSSDQVPSKSRLISTKANLARTLDTNPVYERERFRFGRYERSRIKIRDDFEMEVALTYPPDFDPAKKYPVWMLTYGGPNAPTIKDGWAGGRVFEQVVAAHGVVVLRVDPQSASGKGMVNAKVCYKQLGVKELQDLEDAVDWLGTKKWADTSRVGLSGHSYGGFLTAFALTHSKKFAAGIAGAPVTDWRLYDSIYTERYMGLPSENKEGYDKTSVIKAAKDLHGQLLIVHGLIDDNVHAQNSLQLIAALQKAGKDFEVMVYPNDRHGIQGTHYPQTQLKFILKTMGVGK